jgi:predicted CXXCH cytochrome family protein
MWGVLALAASLLTLAAPAVAAEANAFGLTYAGSETCLTCHGRTTGRWQVGSYQNTPHRLNVRAIDELGGPTRVFPSATSAAWPSPLIANGAFRFNPVDALYQMGGMDSHTTRFVSLYKNDGPHRLSTGDLLPRIDGPADDLVMFNGRYYSHEGYWNQSAITARLVLQNCGPCHFAGVTRPSNTSHTLPNGGKQDAFTPSTMSEHGIQCSSCHAAASGDSHWSAKAPVSRTKQVLRSQTCGQCHVRFSAKQRNATGGSWSSPNGFTADQNLNAFGTVSGSQYIKQSMFAPAPSIPATDTLFYPTGHFKSGGHGDAVYNEWLLSGHSHSLRNQSGQLYIPFLQDSCLPCHSGESFLKSIGYGSDGPNDIGLHRSSIASDTLNIECGVCHAVHGPGGAALRLAADTLCTKCHVEGTAEIRGGHELVGVGDTGEWMPDAKCYQCHMPLTAGFRSHRLSIMLPGEAEEWGVEEGGDSCTPCHGGLTRTRLQSYIDSWQGRTKTAHAKATAALTAAKSRPASSTASGKSLIKDAEHNLKLVSGDGSWGVHNLPYALAGVARAELYAQAVGARFVSMGSTAYNSRTRRAAVHATLRLGTGAGAARQSVTIEARESGSRTWRRVATVTTDANGRFAHAVGPKLTTAYRAKWSPKRGVTMTSATTTVRR